MNRSILRGTPLRMTAYAVVLAAAFGAAFAVGAAAEPVIARSEAPAGHPADMTSDEMP